MQCIYCHSAIVVLFIFTFAGQIILKENRLKKNASHHFALQIIQMEATLRLSILYV